MTKETLEKANHLLSEINFIENQQLAKLKKEEKHGYTISFNVKSQEEYDYFIEKITKHFTKELKVLKRQFEELK